MTYQLPNSEAEIVMTSAMRKDVYLCVKESTNNRIKHAHASAVNVEIAINDLQVEIILQDEGIGMKQNNIFGNGLKQINERLKK